MPKEAEAKAEPFSSPRAVEEEGFSLSVTTDEDFAAGEWVTLPCGLPVQVAPITGTQEADKQASHILRKVDGKARHFDDLKGVKRTDYATRVAARVGFLGFKDPKTGAPEVEINGTIWKDNEPTRLRMLKTLPSIRKEIEVELDAVQERFGTESEETAKN